MKALVAGHFNVISFVVERGYSIKLDTFTYVPKDPEAFAWFVELEKTQKF